MAISQTSSYRPAAGTNAPAVPAASSSASSGCGCSVCSSLQCVDRTRFFAGQLISEADLNNEQSYWLAKSRMHNLALFGPGVVWGLQVVCSPCGNSVVVKPGLAIGPCGEDIVVCADASFNIAKAIQDCCTPRQTANCSPVRTAPPPACQDVSQTFCITIQYQEIATQAVAPLQTPSSSAAGCGCGCGGKNGSTANGSAKKSCGCSTSAAPRPNPAMPATCEPTRIQEGFRLGISAPAPSNTPQQPAGKAGLPAAYADNPCIVSLRQLIDQAPTVTEMQDVPAYQATCNFLVSVRNFLSKSTVTDCQSYSALMNLQVPAPGVVRQELAYPELLQGEIVTIKQSLTQFAKDCLCMSLLPPCPTDPCDDRLVLACVTVQNGKVVDICHFGGGRRQVITFPTIRYWLSVLGVDTSFIGDLFARLCCGDELTQYQLFQTALTPGQPLTTTTFTDPTYFTQIFTPMLTQKLGATILNTSSQQFRTVDLRPLVGQNWDTVNLALAGYQIPTVNRVEAGPEWTDSAVAASPQFAPAAFSVTQPLNVVTKNDLVVGFQPASSVDSLHLQVKSLQDSVDALHLQIKNLAVNPPANDAAAGPPPVDNPANKG